MATVEEQTTTGLATDIRIKLSAVRKHLCHLLRGKEEVVENVLTAILADGAVLLEDVPGVGKTTLAKGLAALIDADFRRLQCTPDLLPSDVVGFSIFNPGDGSFEFRPGPVFCNILLIDEINRASPRTQSALLEAMAERSVTVENEQRPLPPPFIVLATQNPAGFQGTFPLPEAQLDRFAIRLSLSYPDLECEIDLLYDDWGTSAAEDLPSVISQVDLLSAQRAVESVRVERIVGGYIVQIIRGSREHTAVRLGCSPRAAKLLFRIAQARAFLEGRDFVLPDDVQYVAPLVLEHRIVQRNSGISTKDIVAEVLDKTEVPL